MKRIVAIAGLLVTIGLGTAIGQTSKARITFTNSVFNYGDIKEDDGMAYHEFTFTNTGKSPLILQRVLSSCGCTVPKWPKEPIAPGKTGKISVGYNPHGRPGPFHKSITVYSNAETPTVILHIKGNVIPHVKTIDEIYRIALGDAIRFERIHIPFRRIYIGKTYTDTLTFLNFSDKPISVTPNIRGKNYLSVKITPQKVEPGKFGKIVVTYDPGKRNDWGFLVDRFSLSVNGKTINSSPITVSASIEEDFSKLSAEELAKAPQVTFNTTSYDFGNKPEGEKVEYSFTIKNSGKSDLIIRKIRSSCGCTTVSPDKKLLKPGESTQIKASFRTTGYSGRQTKTITVITNDPKHSTMILRITGNVVKKRP